MPWISKIRRGMPFAQRPLYALARRLLRREAGPIGRSPLAAVLALCLGFALSIGAFFTVQGHYRSEAQKNFEGAAI